MLFLINKNFKVKYLWICWILLFFHSNVFSYQQFSGYVPREDKTATLLAEPKSADRIRLSIGLPFRDPEAVNSEIASLYDKKSPNYHKFLTAAEIGDKFGPSQSDYLKVIQYFKSHGFEILNTYPSLLL